jgi:hypothetical protein
MLELGVLLDVAVEARRPDGIERRNALVYLG